MSGDGEAAGPPGDGGLRGVLWDMDGLLVDSEPLWTVAETELAARLGRTWTPEIKASVIGSRLDRAVPLLLGGLGAPTDATTVARTGRELLQRMVELFAASPLPLLPGARALLDALAAAGVPCALVSSSYRVLVDAVLAALPDHPFAVTVAGDEVVNAKPDPEPYLRAARALGVDPACCLVLEDSVIGARAGLAAGCATVLVPGATVAAPATSSGWTAVASLAVLDPARLAHLVAAARDTGSGASTTAAAR